MQNPPKDCPRAAHRSTPRAARTVSASATMASARCMARQSACARASPTRASDAAETGVDLPCRVDRGGSRDGSRWRARSIHRTRPGGQPRNRGRPGGREVRKVRARGRVRLGRGDHLAREDLEGGGGGGVGVVQRNVEEVVSQLEAAHAEHVAHAVRRGGGGGGHDGLVTRVGSKG